MKKTNAIPFWRIIFTYLIILFHFDTTFPWMREAGLVSGWYLAVEFFFMVSGYLIYAKFDEYEKRLGGPLRYTIHRYGALYPLYVLSFVLTFGAIHVLGKSELGVMAHLVHSMPEIILMQGIGIDRGWDWVDPPLWYLSVMIISGFFIYVGLKYIRKFFVGYLAPAAVILFLFLLYENVGTLDAAVMLPGESVNYPLMRGFAEMCLGMYACMFTTILEKRPRLSGVLCTVSMLIAIVLASLYGHSHADFVVLLFLFVGVSAGFVPKTGLSSDTSKKSRGAAFIDGLSEITYEMYLFHELFRTHVFPYFFPRDVGLSVKLFYMLLYALSVTCFAWLVHRIWEAVCKG